VQEGAERCGVIPGLDLVDAGEILQVKELGAEEEVGELCFAGDDGLDASRRWTAPAWAGDEEAPTVVAEGAAAEVGEVVGVEINHLTGVVAGWLNLRQRDNEGLGAEIHPEIGIGRVGVGSDDELVVGGGNGFGAGEGVKCSTVVRAGWVDGLLMHRLVVSGHRKAIDERFLGDGSGFGCGDGNFGRHWILTFVLMVL
jgi:hypothetical protein